MKLSQFDSKTNADAGVKMPLLDPVTRRDSGAGLILFGADSNVHRQARKEIDARNRGLGRSLTAEETADQTVEILARCTKGWYGLKDDNEKELSFSYEAVFSAYKEYPELAERAATFIFNRANFFRTASAG